MKNLFTILFSLLLTFTLVSCNDSKNDNTKNESSSSETTNLDQSNLVKSNPAKDKII